jgi:chemotaxis signal transduction protein
VTTGSRFQQRVVDLRHDFDQAFALPPAVLAQETEDVLLVRIGGDPYAMHSRDLSGLATGKKIAPLPSRRPELIGIVGIRGNLVPVYSLMTLLGYGANSPSSRWLALSRGPGAAGLAFQEFEGFVRVRKEDVHAAESLNARRHIREVVRSGELTRPVVDIASVLEALRAHAGSAGPTKEG